MPKKPRYTITNESATIILDGHTYTVKKGDPNFQPALDAVLSERWEDLPPLFSKGLALEKWAEGEFTFESNALYYKGRKLPDELNERMLNMARRGDSPKPIMGFWEMLQENPSWRSVQELWGFLKLRGTCLDAEGYILAYKGVDGDYMSFHADEDGNYVDNTPGKKPWMPRNKVSDVYNSPCHYGFHVGNYAYASSFGSYNGRGHRIVIVRVNPKDVVTVCSSAEKVRVNTYEVLGNHGMVLPDTVYDVKQDLAYSPSAKPPERKPVSDAASSFADKLGTQRGTVKASAPAEPWLGFGDLSDEELKNQNMENLRRYASRVLRIVGASKLRKFQKDEAGKEVGLVATIIAVRTKQD